MIDLARIRSEDPLLAAGVVLVIVCITPRLMFDTFAAARKVGVVLWEAP
ncbi:MAG: hypothetical protein AAGF57_04670 [Pseudomonadota bacterium]